MVVRMTTMKRAMPLLWTTRNKLDRLDCSCVIHILGAWTIGTREGDSLGF